jgi:adenylosuccinate lyase
MLEKFTAVINGLVVYPDNMAENIDKTRGLVFSQQLMLELVGKGVLREEAYRMVQTNAMKSWNEKLDFREMVSNDEEIKEYLGPDDMDRVFDLGLYTSGVDFIFRRCGLD